MANQRKDQRDPRGTEGGTDTEPLQDGMDEVESKKASRAPERPHTPGQENERETAEKKDPPSPYHELRVSEGGLTPQAVPGEGTTPARPRGEIEATAGRKIAQERGEFENEAANAPRTDPPDRGVDR